MNLFPETKPFDRGYLNVDDVHQLYYEQAGNPEGQPVVWLHGGPGGGCTFQEYRFFNPDYYRVIMFDQRGAGKSTPYASVCNNSIQSLIGDLEKLKNHLSIPDRWHVVGGSWGSALALLYTLQYPDSVSRLLLRALFFADPEGAEYIIEEGGANQFRDDYFQQYRDLVPAEDRRNGLKMPYYNLLINGSPEQQLEAAKRLFLWDIAISTYRINDSLLARIEAHQEEALAITRIFIHFTVNGFSEMNRQIILDSHHFLDGIPIDLVHGENDLICPVENAILFHRTYPHTQLHLLPETGHSMTEPAIMDRFVEITERWRETGATA